MNLFELFARYQGSQQHEAVYNSIYIYGKIEIEIGFIFK